MSLSFVPCEPRARQTAWRSFARTVAAGLLAGLAACASEQPTALSRATVGAPRAYLATTPVAFTQIEAGGGHVCALDGGGAVTCWGANYAGQATVPAAAQHGIVQVSAGERHTCAVNTAGAVSCWGSNVYAQSTPVGPSPTEPTVPPIAQVSAAERHTCAVSTAGGIYCWGGTNGGQSQLTPTPNTGYVQVSAGPGHNCAVTTGGTVSCWGGADHFGETSPPAGLTGVTQVSVGYTHSCARTASGAVTCWGDNNLGQSAVPSAAGSGVVQVTAGQYHTCALFTAGTVACWGDNTYGQATPPAGLTGVTQISAGDSFTCALGAGGAATCWGDNSYGQTTVPATTTRVLPTATFAAPASATAGQAFTLALTGAQVPGYPAATAFTYAFDCGDGQGYAATPNATASCPTTAGETRTVRGKVIDQDGDTASYGASVTVNKAAQTITFSSTPPSPAVVGGSYALSATGGASGNPVTFSSLTASTCTVAGATVHFAVVGSCTVAADQAGTAAYAAASPVTQTITVAGQPQTITFTSTPPSPARVGGTYVVSATASTYYMVAFSSLTPATCTLSGPTTPITVSFIAAGTCVIAADVGGSGVYAPAPEVTQTIPVLAAVASFPATPVLDAFARPDGALGANWGGFAAPLFFRVSQQHGAVSLGGGIGWAPSAFGTTQEAFVTLTALGGNGGTGAQGLVLKGQDPRDHTLGALTVTYAPQRGTVTVAALHAPPAAGTAYPALAVRFAAGDQLGARVTAAGVVTVYRNGALVGTVTLGAADQAYFGARGGYLGLLDLGAPGALFDDFGGGTVGP